MVEFDVLLTAVATALISSVVGAAVSAVVVAMRAANGEAKQMERRQEAMEDGMRCILRQYIVDAYHTHVTRGEPMTLDLSEQLERVHDAYKSLGGNNLGDRLYTQVREKVRVEFR